IFEKASSLQIKRPEKFGGDINIESYGELEKAYASGKLHPADLKAAVAAEINKLLEPIRKHFATNAKARKLAEQVKSFEVTR
ncbi:MAG: tyrosine--tRNA ligase, partial [Candidatus Micrarchaeota archaeon]